MRTVLKEGKGSLLKLRSKQPKQCNYNNIPHHNNLDYNCTVLKTLGPYILFYNNFKS